MHVTASYDDGNSDIYPLAGMILIASFNRKHVISAVANRKNHRYWQPIIMHNSSFVGVYLVDTQWVIAGPGIPHLNVMVANSNPGSDSVANTIYIMPNSQFLTSGDLQFFEYYGSLAGTVTLMVSKCYIRFEFFYMRLPFLSKIDNTMLTVTLQCT